MKSICKFLDSRKWDFNIVLAKHVTNYFRSNRSYKTYPFLELRSQSAYSLGCSKRQHQAEEKEEEIKWKNKNWKKSSPKLLKCWKISIVTRLKTSSGFYKNQRFEGISALFVSYIEFRVDHLDSISYLNSQGINFYFRLLMKNSNMRLMNIWMNWNR